MRKGRVVIVVIALVVILGVVALLVASMGSIESSNLEVSNIQISDDGYGMYNVTCDLTPHTEYSYLEMGVILYDSNGAVIGNSPLVWNMNNPTKDQLIKVAGPIVNDNENIKPARAELFFYDSAFSANDPNSAVYKVNVTING